MIEYTPEVRRSRRLMSALTVSMLKETIAQVKALHEILDEEGQSVNQQAMDILQQALAPLEANANLYARR